MPGTLRIDPEAHETTVRVIAYSSDDYVEKSLDNIDDLADFLEKWPVTWIDVIGLGDESLLRTLGELISVHRLALEDVVNVHQRAKVEDYKDHLFIVARMLLLGDELRNEQISMFLGTNYVVTFQERPGDVFGPVRDRLFHGQGRIRGAGADYLAYALLDAVTDNYFPILEEYGERLEQIEAEILGANDQNGIARLHAIKRDLIVLRRTAWPLRETANTLYRDDLDFVSDATRVYLRDCYDHSVQIIELVESYREIAAGLLDLHMSSISNRMNEVMKVLTIIATIFIPLGFIAGMYGMNFNAEISPFNMPELDWYLGYPLVLLVMAGVVVGMLTYFWRKGWIGGGRS